MAGYLWLALFLLTFLFPYLQHFVLKRNLNFPDSVYERSGRSFVFFIIYSLFGLFWYVVFIEGKKDEDMQYFFIQGMALSTLLSIWSVVLILTNKEFNLSWRQRTKFSLFAVLLIPTLPNTVFLVVLVARQNKKANKLKDIRTKWVAEREEFLKKYKKASRRLEKLRSGVKSQEQRINEFSEANPDAVLHRAPKNAREFEIICANWMQLWGEIDAQATQFSGDGGIDVVSSNFGAQVKFYADKPVGRPEMQALYGAASGHGLQPAFFAYSNGYTNEALEWGKMMGIACFTFNFVPERNRFEFEANTEQAAELALREEGWSYLDWQEWTELEETFKTFQQEPPAYVPPSWLRKKDAAVASQTTAVEISVE